MQGLTDDRSKLGQWTAWWCLATRLYMNQCWPSSVMPYDVTRGQWVKHKILLTLTLKCRRVNCKKYVTPVGWQWSYIFLALTHRYKLQIMHFINQLPAVIGYSIKDVECLEYKGSKISWYTYNVSLIYTVCTIGQVTLAAILDYSYRYPIFIPWPCNISER